MTLNLKVGLNFFLLDQLLFVHCYPYSSFRNPLTFDIQKTVISPY